MASAIFKFIKDLGDIETNYDEGVFIGYAISDTEYLDITLSKHHFAVTVGKDNEWRTVIATETLNGQSEEEFYNRFVLLGIGNETYYEDFGKLLMLSGHFKKTKMRFGPRFNWSNKEIQEDYDFAMEVIKKVRYDTKLIIAYNEPGESNMYNFGSPDSWIYSSVEPSEEMEDSIRLLKENLIKYRRDFVGTYVVKIQATYRAWRDRLKYSFDPMTSLGKYYVMKAFDELQIPMK
jgi:hypothetical protein